MSPALEYDYWFCCASEGLRGFKRHRSYIIIVIILRWEDCVKRDLRKAEEEEKWREKADNREQIAVLPSDQ